MGHVYKYRKIPQGLETFARLNNLTVEKIKYNFQGLLTSDGFSLIDRHNIEIFCFEPTDYPKDSSYKKDRWRVSSCLSTYTGPKYISRITYPWLCANIVV